MKIRGSGATERTGGGLGGLARRRRPHLFLGRGTGLGSELVLSFCTKKMEPQCILFSAVGCRRFGANIFQRPSPPVGTTQFHAQHPLDWLVGLLETQAPVSCQPSNKTHLPAKHDTEIIAKAGQSVQRRICAAYPKKNPGIYNNSVLQPRWPMLKKALAPAPLPNLWTWSACFSTRLCSSSYGETESSRVACT